MVSDPMIRASDRDRDAVVATLREAFTEGRLTLEEFEERMAAAYAGRTWGDLRSLTADLPVQPVLGADLPSGARGLPVPGAGGPGQPDVPPAPGASVPPDQEMIPPSSGERRGRPFALVVPVTMWVLVALATRSVEGAMFFIVALVLLVTFSSIGRRRR